jgi:ribosome maturation factor RimP
MDQIRGRIVPCFFVMISINYIREIVQNRLSEGENYLVDVTVSSTNMIRVTIDNLNGISIQECVGMSRWIESQLELETENFELEVSSPGLDQPFKVLQQYQKYMGKAVEVKLADGQKVEGKLLEVNPNGIYLEQQIKENVEGKKGKQLVLKKSNLIFSQIKETRIIIKF